MTHQVDTEDHKARTAVATKASQVNAFNKEYRNPKAPVSSPSRP